MTKTPNYSNFFYLNPLPSWVYDLEDLHIIDVNQAALAHYGYSREEFLNLSLEDLRTTKEVSDHIHTDLSTKNIEGNIHIGCHTHQKKDGTLIQMEINGHKLDFNDRECMLVVCQDVTEQKQKVLEKELLGKISLNFSSEKDLVSSSKLLCQTICDYGRFDFAELWLPNIENNLVQLIAKHAASSEANTFYKYSEHVRSFKPSEGLPGAVWNKKTTLLWKDIRKKYDFVRQEAAEKAGIQNAMGIPLLFNDQIVGVLLIGTQEEIYYLNKYVKLFEQFEHFIGSEINRKRLENDLSHLYDAIPDIISVGDFKGKILRINKGGCDLLGYAEDEILHQSFEKFIHPDDLDIALEELGRLQVGHSTFGFEVRFLTKPGELLWLSWYCKANVNEGLIYSSAKNITEEKKLRQLNKQAGDLAKVGSWEYDLVEDNLFWSEEVHRLHETDPNTFVPNIARAIDFYKEEHKAYVSEVIHKGISEGTYLDYEAVIITKSKKERWIRVIASPEYIEGRCVKFIGSFQDITDRKEAENRLQNLSDNIPGVVFQYLLHPDGTDEFRYVSKGSEKIWGYSPEEVTQNIDLVWDQIKAGGSFEAVKQSIIESVENKSQWSIRYRTITPDGQKRILHGLGTPNFSADGTVEYNSVVLDITEETKNEELLELATDLARIGSWEVDVVSNKLYWTDTVYELHETDPESFEPDLEASINFYKEDFRQMVKEELTKAIETGLGFDFEAVIITAKKHERWVRVIGNTELVNGVCRSVYGSFQDIHELKVAGLRLTQANERFEKVTEATSDAIWDWDVENNSFYRSDVIDEFFGVGTVKHLQRKDFWHDKFHQEDLGNVRESLRIALKDPTIEKWEIQYRIFNDKDEIIYVNDRALIVRNKQGKAIRMIGAMTDITERKNFEKQLIELNDSLKKYTHELELTNEELEQFAYIASHDLQEPLRMVTSFLNLLKRKYEGQLDDKAHQFIDFAADGAKRMKQIILDLLEYSRAGKVTSPTREINMSLILDDYQVLRKKLIAEKNIRLKIGELPVIQYHSVPITQILHSLVDNAIKYSKEEESPVIHIYSEELPDFFKIVVKDNGIGIDPKFHEKIFVIFQRLHNKDKYSGSGIGLSVAKKHIESYGGKIWLDSKAGVGSTFYFTVPKHNNIN